MENTRVDDDAMTLWHRPFILKKNSWTGYIQCANHHLASFGLFGSFHA